MSKINWKKIEVKPVINKCNGQINISLQKKKLPPNVLKKVTSGKLIDLLFEDD